MIKRLADWLEKMSVAAFAIGLFQGRETGMAIAAIALGIVTFTSSMAISGRMERSGK